MALSGAADSRQDNSRYSMSGFSLATSSCVTSLPFSKSFIDPDSSAPIRRRKLANSSSGCIITSPVSLRSAKHTGHFKTDPLRVYGPTALQAFLKPPQLAAQASLALAHSIYYLLRIHPSGRLAQFWTNVIEVLNAREGR
jgi:hypothetical protein